MRNNIRLGIMLLLSACGGVDQIALGVTTPFDPDALVGMPCAETAINCIADHEALACVDHIWRKLICEGRCYKPGAAKPESCASVDPDAFEQSCCTHEIEHG